MHPILIIGATSQVAADVARLYATRGEKLVLVARNQEKLAQLQAELSSSVVGTWSMDFTQTEAIPRVVQELYDAHGAFDVALIAHGYLGDQRESELDFHEALAQFSVNYLSAVAWLIPLANAMEARRWGKLCAITSVAGDRGRPRNYTYGSSKGALGLYLQGLRSRLYKKVPVTTIKLGPVRTPMTADHQKNRSFISSEQAALGIVRAIDGGRNEVYVPGFWKPVLWAVKAMPEPLFQRLGFLSAR